MNQRPSLPKEKNNRRRIEPPLTLLAKEKWDEKWETIYSQLEKSSTYACMTVMKKPNTKAFRAISS